MLIEIPSQPNVVIVGPDGRTPRYWSTVWTLLCHGNSAASTRLEAMRHLDFFYVFADERSGLGALDTAIGASDTSAIIDTLQAFYAELSSKSAINAYATKRYATAQRFITDLGALRVHIAPEWQRIETVCAALAPLKRRRRDGSTRFIRALPVATLADLLAILAPGSSRNPAIDESVKVRNWVITQLLLLMGLRRGECLVLPVDALKEQVDPRTGELRWWLDVVEHDEDEDPRFTKPSIKTAQSRRQLPVSPSLAKLITLYVEQWRGAPHHEFLFSSREGTPLSAESVNALFRDASTCFAAAALQEFRDRSGGKASVSPHDLRHTCAVVRLKQFLAEGISHDEAMQRMRSFFGWSYESQMPLHYAKAAFEERLADVWGNTFDSHTNILRALPQ